MIITIDSNAINDYIERLLGSAGANCSKENVYAQVRGICRMMHTLSPMYMTAPRMQSIYNRFIYAGVWQIDEVEVDNGCSDSVEQSVSQNNQDKCKDDVVLGDKTGVEGEDAQPQSD